MPNAPVQANTEATTERVIVTGSYIPTAETESALPVTVYTAEVLKKQGANTPVEGLRQLPSFVGNAATENDSNGGDGSATINLRGIGSANTLILVNGRRTFNFNDINALPISGISRTEVLKDGASAVYGSDGVAGVVNFILVNGPGEKPYEGAELFAFYGNTTETDAHVRQVYLRGGVTGLDGKVSIAAGGEYYSRANLFSRDRTIAVTGDASNNPQGLGLGGQNSNSPTFGGRVTVNPGATSMGAPQGGGTLVLINLANNQVGPGSYRRFEPPVIGNPANCDTPGFLPCVRPPNGALPGDFPVGTDPSRFNFRAFTPAIPAMEKAMYWVTGRYKIFGDGLQLYGDIMYSKVKQDNGLAGAPFTLSTPVNGLTEARASNFNPFGNELAAVAYRLQQELRNRRSFFDKDYYRYLTGVNGDFNIKDNGFISRFGYDAGFVYERLNYQRIDSGDARRSYLRALIAPNITATAPGIVPPIAPGYVPPPTAPIPGVPPANRGTFNPFIGVSAPVTGTAPIYNNTNSFAPQFRTGVPIGVGAYDNTIAAQDWTVGGASYVGHSFFYERDWLADAKINMHLFPNLWNGGIDVAGGYERREINQKQIPDPVQASNDQLGFNQSPPLKFRQEVESWFFELGIPLVTSSMNVPWIRSLDLDIAWRRETFNDTNLLLVTGSPVNTSASFVNENPDENFGGSPRVSLRYQPIADLTLRFSWGQSFRSPSPNELFSPVFQNFPVVFDPVNNTTLQPPLGVWEGGNTDLVPETTDAYSAGLVWTPKFVPGFTMTLDVYELFTTALVLDGDSFAQVLLFNGTLDPDGCGLGVNGNSGPGLGATYSPQSQGGGLSCIDSGNGNAGKRHVRGLDLTAVYELPTEHWGKFTFSGGFNHFFTWKAQPGQGQAFTSFLGNYNNGTLPLAPGAIPWNKGFLRGEWEWRHFDFVATGNYVGDFRDDPSFDTIARDEPRNVPSYMTLDMQLSYEFVKPPVEPAPYVKESKDSKNVMQTEASVASIWQRMLWGTKLTVGVNDAFDRQPPSVIAAFNDNYDTSLYSIRNRYWYVSLTKKF
ncbi:MAG TPA: TonB-dependent receptor [Verrucomicrobiae bacterium]|nr:TonB-dependent receptor [Verrucomicrobiae bacterium]